MIENIRLENKKRIAKEKEKYLREVGVWEIDVSDWDRISSNIITPFYYAEGVIIDLDMED
jgi:hypothetical protein